jgi:GntR family transcriptional repressor for pyruvate dehydrogenase complex
VDELLEEAKYRPFRRRRAYEHVLEQMKAQILSGQFQPEEKLPTEYDLSQRFHVSRAVIQQAMAILSMMGLIEIKQGSGCYVCSSPGRLISTSLEFSLTVEKGSPTSSIISLLELKEMMESRAAFLAAQRVTPEIVSGLEQALEAMGQSLDSPTGFLKANYSFHQTIAQASGNCFMESIILAILRLVDDIIPDLVANPRELALDLAYHQDIFAAIRDGRPEEASQAIMNHILNIERQQFSLW